MLPNFFIIGAAKGGTHALWTYLREHPDVFMPERKEFDFFCDADWQARMQWYEEQFTLATEPVRGEASVYYSMHPFKPGVPARIAEFDPGAKLIYIVRDPVPRAVAHFVQNVQVGYDERPIDEAFADFEDPGNEYVAASRYATQLREYLEHFPAEQIFVADQSRLLNERGEVIRELYEFLGVDPEFTSEKFSELVHTRSGLLLGPTKLGWRLRSTGPARLLRRMPPGVSRPIRKLARRAFDRKVERWPELDPALAERVADHLRDEVSELSELTGQSFPDWSITPDPARV